MQARISRWSATQPGGHGDSGRSLVDVGILRLRAAEASDAADPAAPVVMEMNAVTLELVCRDGATEGEFHPIRCRMLEATTWGGNQQSHADLTGYSAQPGGRGRGKQANRPKRNPAAQQAGRRHHGPGHAQAGRRDVGGRRDPGDRHAGGQGRHPFAGRRLRHAPELPRRQDHRPAIARGNPFRRRAQRQRLSGRRPRSRRRRVGGLRRLPARRRTGHGGRRPRRFPHASFPRATATRFGS